MPAFKCEYVDKSYSHFGAGQILSINFLKTAGIPLKIRQ